MALPFYNWSRTAASNSTADSTVNWAEGQAPSSVNDSARAMMASTAAFRDDISGAIVTGGTSSAYTVTSYQVFDTLAHLNGKVIAFTPHTSNAEAPTLNVDGLGAKAIRRAADLGIYAGTLVAGTPYAVTYNSSDGVFYLNNFHASPWLVPLGVALPFFGTTAPNSQFVLPYGQAISRTTYVDLFSMFGTTFGVGDGSTTFNIPDLRGRGVVGKDDMGGSAASRLTTAGGGVDGATLGAVGGAQNGTILQANLPAATLTTTITDPGHVHTIDVGSSGGGSDQVTQGVAGVSATVTGPVNSATTGITASTALGGSGTAFKLVQPSIVGNYIMRVL